MQETLDRDLIILLHELAHTLRIRSDRAAGAHGMTRAQWIILARLSRQPGMTQNELASICEVEPITIGRLIDRLEARGLVERRTDPNDRRVRRLELLPAARPFLEEMAVYRAELNADMTRNLSKDELERLIDTLLQIKANLAVDGASCPKRQSAGG